MHKHLTRVIEGFLDATEVKELERARAVVAEKRQRYSVKRYRLQRLGQECDAEYEHAKASARVPTPPRSGTAVRLPSQ